MRSISVPRHVKTKTKSAALWVKENAKVLLIKVAITAALIFLASVNWYYCVTFGIGVAACFAASVLAEDSRVLSFLAAIAAILAGGVFVIRGWLHAGLGFNPSYNPTHWLVLVAIATMVIGVFAMRRWILIPGMITIAAIISLFFVGPDAFRTFQAAANVIYQTPAEEDETKKRQPSVEILSDLDKTCSPEYAVPSKMEDGDRLVPNWEAIGKVAGPEEVVSAVNPDLLLEKIQQEIDSPNFAKKWEENSREEIGTAGDDFNQADFDSFVTGVKEKTTVPDNLIVRYGNGLCPTPYAKAAHVTFYGW